MHALSAETYGAPDAWNTRGRARWRGRRIRGDPRNGRRDRGLLLEQGRHATSYRSTTGADLRLKGDRVELEPAGATRAHRNDGCDRPGGAAGAARPSRRRDVDD